MAKISKQPVPVTGPGWVVLKEHRRDIAFKLSCTAQNGWLAIELPVGGAALINPDSIAIIYFDAPPAAQAGPHESARAPEGTGGAGPLGAGFEEPLAPQSEHIGIEELDTL